MRGITQSPFINSRHVLLPLFCSLVQFRAFFAKYLTVPCRCTFLALVFQAGMHLQPHQHPTVPCSANKKAMQDHTPPFAC